MMRPMPSHEEDLKSQLEELRHNAHRLVERVEQAIETLESGDVQLSCDIAKQAEVEVRDIARCHDTLVDAFERFGYTPRLA
jgi:ElaB/YqjD/DUF883 family membrane-anchored ribosome-binding protein